MIDLFLCVVYSLLIALNGYCLFKGGSLLNLIAVAIMLPVFIQSIIKMAKK